MNSKKKLFPAILCLMLLAGTLTGCQGADGEVSGKNINSDGSSEAGSTAGLQASTDIDLPDTDNMFTNRDKEVGYDESSAVAISLADSSSSSSDASVVISGDTVTIGKEGTYVISGALSNGQIIVDAPDSAKLHLILNNVTINSDTSAAIYVRQADKVFVTLAAHSENMLSNTSEYVAIDDNNIDAVIFSKDDLTLNGDGSLCITAAYGHGIVSKNDLVITGGVYEITAEKHALAGKDSVRIADGSLTLSAGKDGIHSENTDDVSKGFVYIEGGSIDVVRSYEGIEGVTILIAGGKINVTASDDGLNAAGGTESTSAGRGGFEATTCNYISISGGTLNVNADGDGIDSNGSLSVSGGEIYVSGPTNSGNGALDYAGTAVISGGIVVATGAQGMAQNFSAESTQGSMLVTVADQLLDGELTLSDANGNVLVRCTPAKSYNSVVISCPDLTVGQTYTLTTGDTTTTVTMSDLIYGEEDMGGGFGKFHGFGGDRPDRLNGDKPERPDGDFPRQSDGNFPKQSDGDMAPPPDQSL